MGSFCYFFNGNFVKAKSYLRHFHPRKKNLVYWKKCDETRGRSDYDQEERTLSKDTERGPINVMYFIRVTLICAAGTLLMFLCIFRVTLKCSGMEGGQISGCLILSSNPNLFGLKVSFIIPPTLIRVAVFVYNLTLT